ncbi:MAG: hypothetical protein MUE40_12345 [Anaerolineae bacterium]|jgi:hypothetical protein|nr:hypothetical protein [Anaerolineae bacterium]
MTTQGAALYQLQTIDLALLEHGKRLQAIAALLADDAARRAAESAVSQAGATLRPRQTHLRDLELQAQSNRSKREATEKRLYSGMVKNPKELQEMQQEIEALKRRDRDLEDALLESMVSVEEAQAALQQSEAHLARVTEQQAQTQATLRSEQTLLEQTIARLKAERSTAAATITAENLALYNGLRAAKQNRPVARLEGDSCSVCGIEQTGIVAQEIRKNPALQKCRNCGRLLVVAPK